MPKGGLRLLCCSQERLETRETWMMSPLIMRGCAVQLFTQAERHVYGNAAGDAHTAGGKKRVAKTKEADHQGRPS